MSKNNESGIRVENIQPILSVKDMALSREFYVNNLDLKRQNGETIISPV